LRSPAGYWLRKATIRVSRARPRRGGNLIGTAFGILLAFPLFWLLDTRDPTIVLWTIVGGICLAQGMVFALHASFMPELFGTKVRYSGISFGFQVGAAIGGGITPVIATALAGLAARHGHCLSFWRSWGFSRLRRF
jgi:hypothetical protein